MQDYEGIFGEILKNPIFKDMQDKVTRTEQKLLRRRLEYHNIEKTKVTDLNMVNIHIDIALMNRDEEQFKRLVKQKEDLERESRRIGMY